ISEMNIDDFFKPLVKIDDWFGEEEKKWANDAQMLQNLLTDKLKHIQIFRVGRIAIDIYLFGKAEDCLWVGLKTKVVET
ncbi:MAG: nuclease A inhibitor family protein, partial [Arcicella sp.]|nr:nuclease A inhibitor family protein [Arcicella sp.]